MQKLISRYLKPQILEVLHQGKVIVLYGARRTGKTTLVKDILVDYAETGRYLNCDLLSDRNMLQTTDHRELFSYLGGYKLVVIDEAQSIPNIGLVLKILVDTFPEIQVIAIGSSSFDLANKIGEPLTGRSRQFMMFPLSLGEIGESGYDRLSIESGLGNLLRFGSMPSVFDRPESQAIPEIQEIATNYLYRDVLMHEKLKKSELLDNLLEVLALQLGSEVSYNELAQTLNTSPQTIQKYIELLEKSFVVFRIKSLCRNPRKELEIKNSRKVYFYDLGVRNSIVRNFNPINLRTDIGALWENFCILELMKKLNRDQIFYNQYFWRTKGAMKEIDLVIDYGGQLKAYEFKWNQKKIPKFPTQFQSFYTGATFTVVNSQNFWNELV
ncbi:MAG: ATP-binding protein [Candidatus Parcubacteria bacterium]|nr:ATP-binding protein [Candidatus Paceibacterota bacterium]